jgi:lactoylglutathione lyase
MIRQLAHLCFHTDRTAQMVAFYQGLLGLPIKFTLTGDDGQTLGYYFECGQSTFIEIFDQARAIKQWGGQLNPLAAGNRYQHFCLEVIGLEDYRASLEARGISVPPITVGMDGSRQAWIADPDGNAIELMEYTPRSLQVRGPG